MITISLSKTEYHPYEKESSLNFAVDTRKPGGVAR
jgi:hypothetical protein